MRRYHSVGATLSAAIVLIGTDADATVILVPETAPSIKAAVDMAASGDEIIVGSNTWSGADNRDIHLQGKQLWIRSAAGPEGCIIDPGRLGRGFILDGGESAGTVIEGITFKNCRALGFYQIGGAIRIAATSSLSVKDCVFDSNLTDLNGRGGAIANAGTLSVTDSSFLKNTAYYFGGRGGAIYNTGVLTVGLCHFDQNVGNEALGGAISNDADATIVDSTFNDNTGQAGGALSSTSGTITVSGCSFVSNGNGATYGGGAVSISTGTASFTDCLFDGNVTATISGGGGAVTVLGAASVSLQRCGVYACVAGSNGGGGVLVKSGTVDIVNSVIDGCSSWIDGGAIRVIDGTAAVRSSTIVQNAVINAASGGGAGISVLAAGASVVRNSIIWANTATGAIGQLAQVSVIAGGSFVIDWSCVQGLDGSLGGAGNTILNPMFSSMLGPDGLKGTTDDNLRPTAPSPCVDGGGDANVPLESSLDLDRLPRIVDGNGDGVAIIDIGAYERANPFDLTGDGVVGAADLATLLGAWGTAELAADLDGNGAVEGADLALLLGAWTS